MDYRHQNAIESCIKKVHKEQGTIEKAQEMNDELEKTYDKAKAFDEIKKYALNNHDEFEDRKDRARNHIEYDYFRTLQIANNAVINKCKQLEGEE